MVRCFSLQARRVGHTLAAPHPLAACTKQRMVCPCGVSSVALFTLPAAFAKFSASGPEEEGCGSFPCPSGRGAHGIVRPATNPTTTSVAPLFARVGYARRSSSNAVRPLAAGISSLAAPPASPSVPRPGTWPLAVRLSGSWQSRTLWLLAPRSCARRRRARRRSSRAVCSVRSSRGGKAVPNRSCCCSSS